MIRWRVNNQVPTWPGRLIYDANEYSFDFKPNSFKGYLLRAGNLGTTTLAVGTLQIEIGIETGLALFVWGYHPHTAWRLGRLPEISRMPIGMQVETDEALLTGVAIGLAEANEWPTIYDPSTGWLCIGNPSLTSLSTSLEFATDTVGVLEGELLQALWLRPYTESAGTELVGLGR